MDSRLITPKSDFSRNILGKAVRPFADAKGYKFVRVQYRPLKSLDMPIERFFASLRFEQWGKLDQLGINIGSIE